MSIAARVANRYFLAEKALAAALRMALADAQKGNLGNVRKALDDFQTVLGIEFSSSGDWGRTIRFRADWMNALSPQKANRLRGTVFTCLENAQRAVARAIRYAPDNGSDTKCLADLLEQLIVEATWLEKAIRFDDPQAFQHGDFTIVPMPGVPGAKQSDCLEALDAVASLVRDKFPQVLYGKIYLAKSVANGLANYTPSKDILSLGLRAEKTVGSIHAICHELGHRYSHRFWKDFQQRLRFNELSTMPKYKETTFDHATRAKLADELLEMAGNVREGKAPKISDLASRWVQFLNISSDFHNIQTLMRRYTQDKDDSKRKELWNAFAWPSSSDISVPTMEVERGPLTVSPYGAKNVEENFAEAFAMYCMGKPLPTEITEIMSSLK